jgi:hypothetical protein
MGDIIPIPSRRGFLAGLGAALVTAPAIVRATSLMPVKQMLDDGVVLHSMAHPTPGVGVLSFGVSPTGYLRWESVSIADVVVDGNGDQLLSFEVLGDPTSPYPVIGEVRRLDNCSLSFNKGTIAYLRRRDGTDYIRVDGGPPQECAAWVD